MKVNKKVYDLLENYYNTNINEPRGDTERGMADYEDLPYVYDDNEYKTSLSAEDIDLDETLQEIMEDIEDKFEDPVIRTKKGKNILREPPSPDPDDNEIHKIKIYDDDIKDLDRKEPEDTVRTFDEDSDLLEQGASDEEDDDPNNLGSLSQQAVEQNPGTGMDPNTDPNQVQPNPSSMMGGAYQDPSMMSQPQIDPQTGMPIDSGAIDVDPLTGQPRMTLDVVGKVYELKKIYSRLLAIQSQLSFSSDSSLTDLRKLITQAIDLFETVISNIGLYKKEIDEIIITYYSFIKQAYEVLRKFYKHKFEEEQKNK